MKKSLILTVLILCDTLCMKSQLTQTFLAIGGSQADDIQKVIQEADSSYTLMGSTYSFGAPRQSIKITRLDKHMNLQWAKIIGTNNAYLYGKDMTRNWDGGYAVTGFVTSSGYNRIYIARLNSNADTLWTRSFGLSYQGWAGMSIASSSDHGFVVTGHGTSTNWTLDAAVVLKFDSVGTLQWKQIMNGYNLNSDGNAVIQSANGGYVFTGATDSSGIGFSRINLSELDGAGQVVWSKAIGASFSQHLTYGTGIARTNHGYLICGTTQAYGAGRDDIYVVKTDTSGHLLWTRTIGGAKSDYGYRVITTSDGGAAVTGGTKSFNDTTNGDMFLLKLDSIGNLSWMRTIGGTAYDYGFNLTQTHDGGYAVSGQTNSFGHGNGDGYLAIFDASGNNCLAANVTPTISSGGQALNAQNTLYQAGNFIHYTHYFIPVDSVMQLCYIVTAVDNANAVSKGAAVYPNPNHGQFTIQLTGYEDASTVDIYNVIGNKVYTGTLHAHETLIDIKGLAPGVYTYLVNPEKAWLSSRGKFIIGEL